LAVLVKFTEKQTKLKNEGAAGVSAFIALDRFDRPSMSSFPQKAVANYRRFFLQSLD